MNDKLMKRLTHNYEKVQDPTIKQLLADAISELANNDTSKSNDHSACAQVLAQLTVESEEKMEALEALTFKSIEAVRNMPKGRLPSFMHRVDTTGMGGSISIKLPGDKDTYVIRSRECINAQKALRTSADASATKDGGGSST